MWKISIPYRRRDSNPQPLEHESSPIGLFMPQNRCKTVAAESLCQRVIGPKFFKLDFFGQSWLARKIKVISRSAIKLTCFLEVVVHLLCSPPLLGKNDLIRSSLFLYIYDQLPLMCKRNLLASDFHTFHYHFYFTFKCQNLAHILTLDLLNWFLAIWSFDYFYLAFGYFYLRLHLDAPSRSRTWTLKNSWP